MFGLINAKNAYRLTNLMAAGYFLHEVYKDPTNVPFEYLPLGLLRGYEALFPNHGHIFTTLTHMVWTPHSALNWFFHYSYMPQTVSGYNTLLHCANLIYRDQKLAQDIERIDRENKALTPAKNLYYQKQQTTPQDSLDRKSIKLKID